jgi:hypothetical protein
VTVGGMILSGSVDLRIKEIIIASGNAVLSGSATVVFDQAGSPSGKCILQGNADVICVIQIISSGNTVLGNTALSKTIFIYDSSGGCSLSAGAIYAVPSKIVLGGSASVQVFRIADLPLGGCRLDSEFSNGYRYFAYAASGGLIVTIPESTHSFIEKTPYFLPIENDLLKGRLNPCPNGSSISKHAVAGLMQGTTILPLLNKADNWEITCFNNPNEGDITIFVYKDQNITKIVWNLFHPLYPHTIIDESDIERESDFKQYKLEINYPEDVIVFPDIEPETTPNIGYEPSIADGPKDKLSIYYPGDSVIVVKDEAPIETPNIGTLPTIRTEIIRGEQPAPTISQSGLLGILGPSHYLRNLPKSDWRILKFKNKTATVEIKGKNKIEVTV